MHKDANRVVSQPDTNNSLKTSASKEIKRPVINLGTGSRTRTDESVKERSDQMAQKPIMQASKMQEKENMPEQEASMAPAPSSVNDSDAYVDEDLEKMIKNAQKSEGIANQKPLTPEEMAQLDADMNIQTPTNQNQERVVYEYMNEDPEKMTSEVQEGAPASEPSEMTPEQIGTLEQGMDLGSSSATDVSSDNNQIDDAPSANDMILNKPIQY